MRTKNGGLNTGHVTFGPSEQGNAGEKIFVAYFSFKYVVAV